MQDCLYAQVLGKGAHLTQGTEAVAAMVGLIGSAQGVVLPRKGESPTDVFVVMEEILGVGNGFQGTVLFQKTELGLSFW